MLFYWSHKLKSTERVRLLDFFEQTVLFIVNIRILPKN